MGNVIGRQPEVLYITPSKPNPWYGCPVAGERFTREQLYRLKAMEIDAATVEAITVYRNATTREMYWPLGSLPPVYAFECPVLRRHASMGRIRVIAPGGDVKLVYADGWITPPPRTGRGAYRRSGQ